MTASAQGVDVSSFQAPVTVAELKAAGYSFAFCKATNGVDGTDLDFAANWATIAEAGIWRGAYHELTTENVAEQAQHFTATVRAQGVKAGDLMAVVASDYAGVTGTEVAAFASIVRAAFPACVVLVYSDLSVLPQLGEECTVFPLWLAYYGNSAPASVAPWDGWSFWQWAAGGGADGGDRNAFNGTAADLAAFIAPYTKAAPWTFGAVRGLDAPSIGPHSVRLEWSAPSAFVNTPPTPAPGIKQYEIAVTLAGGEAVLTSELIRKGSNPQSHQVNGLKPGTQYEAHVRVYDTEHAGPWTPVTFTTRPAA
jgi:GH25 family lysozyme M1 (1,4-beta-N-acetylmuramidase)